MLFLFRFNHTNGGQKNEAVWIWKFVALWKWYGWRMVSFFVFLSFFLFVCHIFIVTWNLLKILIRVERIPKSNPKFILAEGTMISRMVPVHLIDLLNKVNYGLDVDGRPKIASGILLSCQSLYWTRNRFTNCADVVIAGTNIHWTFNNIWSTSIINRSDRV